jgi:hypothetical protein
VTRDLRKEVDKDEHAVNVNLFQVRGQQAGNCW